MSCHCFYKPYLSNVYFVNFFVSSVFSLSNLFVFLRNILLFCSNFFPLSDLLLFLCFIPFVFVFLVSFPCFLYHLYTQLTPPILFSLKTKQLAFCTSVVLQLFVLQFFSLFSHSFSSRTPTLSLVFVPFHVTTTHSYALALLLLHPLYSFDSPFYLTHKFSSTTSFLHYPLTHNRITHTSTPHTLATHFSTLLYFDTCTELHTYTPSKSLHGPLV